MFYQTFYSHNECVYGTIWCVVGPPPFPVDCPPSPETFFKFCRWINCTVHKSIAFNHTVNASFLLTFSVYTRKCLRCVRPYNCHCLACNSFVHLPKIILEKRREHKILWHKNREALNIIRIMSVILCGKLNWTLRLFVAVVLWTQNSISHI